MKYEISKEEMISVEYVWDSQLPSQPVGWSTQLLPDEIRISPNLKPKPIASGLALNLDFLFKSKTKGNWSFYIETWSRREILGKDMLEISHLDVFLFLKKIQDLNDKLFLF